MERGRGKPNPHSANRRKQLREKSAGDARHAHTGQAGPGREIQGPPCNITGTRQGDHSAPAGHPGLKRCKQFPGKPNHPPGGPGYRASRQTYEA
jgi:hypothetical protein